MGNSSSTDSVDDTDRLVDTDALLSEKDEEDITTQIHKITSHGCSKYKEKEFEYLKDHDYPFENLVFKGGGGKGSAYTGTIRVLEDFGILGNIKRFAGTSFGAIIASFLAVGFSADEIETILRQEVKSSLLTDASCPFFTFLPNMLRRYGVHPGNRLYNFFGEKLKNKTGNPDVTFEEVYKKFGKELCIVVTNLNNMREEYWHPKTTPTKPVRLALRMTVSFPGIFQPVKRVSNGVTSYYVDGGIVCNYPLHCFDGWWLSMKPGDNFLERIGSLHKLTDALSMPSQFREKNPKTLGFFLTSENDPDMHKYALNKRTQDIFGVPYSRIPDTELARYLNDHPPDGWIRKEDVVFRKELEKVIRGQKVQDVIIKAVDEFLKSLKKHDVSKDDIIHLCEMEKAFADPELSDRSKTILFGNGKVVSAREAFDHLDANGDGEVSFHELMIFLERKEGLHFQQLYTGYKRQEVNGFSDFLSASMNTESMNLNRLFMQSEDLERTVGIDTAYIGFSDYDLSDEDIEFLLQQGRQSTLAFLKEYVEKREQRRASESVFENIPLTPMMPIPTENQFLEMVLENIPEQPTSPVTEL